MAYEIQTWSNRPSTDTPVNAQRLNHMEQGIYDSYFASNISFDKSGCKIISKDNIQEALKELDASTNAINQNLTALDSRVGKDILKTIGNIGVVGTPKISNIYRGQTNEGGNYIAFYFVDENNLSVQLNFWQTGLIEFVVNGVTQWSK